MSWWDNVKGFLGGAFSVVSGAGSVAGAVEEVAKVADDGIAVFTNKQYRDEGAQAQQLKDATDELAAIREGNSAASDPTVVKLVRDKYEIKRPA